MCISVFEMVTLCALYSPGFEANLKVKFCEVAFVVNPFTRSVVAETRNNPSLISAFSLYCAFGFNELSCGLGEVCTVPNAPEVEIVVGSVLK